jgi:monofunctional biosynthetic peptidoglycan transglycosylase
MRSSARADHTRLRILRPLSVLRTIGIVIAVVVLLPYLLTPLSLVVNQPSTLMLWRWATGQRVERIFVPLARMGRYLPETVLVAEDARFCSHYGVDFREMQHALDDSDDIADMRGFSTITQQTVKNLFLWPGRSYVRKALEIPLALWFDLVVPKRRILEIYLNIAQWGPDGEFGAAAAARRDFGRPVARLTERDAALLAAALPNPFVRDPKHPSHMLRRLADLYRMRAARATGFDCIRARS